MSYQSVLAGAISLMQTNVAGLVTIGDMDDRLQADIPRDAAPALLFTRGAQAVTDRLAGGHPGTMARTWYLDGHLWAYYNPLTGSALLFDALVESIENTFETKLRIGGLADTTTSVVGIAAEGQQAVRTSYSPVIRVGATAERHALISIRIREWLTV